MEMSFWDGRSYGVATQFIASGLQKQNGIITEYSFEEIDISCAEFVDAHKNCVFLSHGDLKIYDQLDNITLTTDIGNLSYKCVEFFPELSDCKQLTIRSSELEFLKMKELLVEQTELASPPNKVPLNEKIQTAAVRVADSFGGQPKDYEH
jgi:hypothetical protein